MNQTNYIGFVKSGDIPPTLTHAQARELLSQAVTLGKYDDLVSRVNRGLANADTLPLVRVNNLRTMAAVLEGSAA